jgi:hypothetical protein
MRGFGGNDFGFGSSGGGGGSAADVIYKGQSPTTITVGGLPAGSQIYGLSLQQIDQDILCPFIIPTFASYYSNISSPLEVGTTLTGNKTFYWSFNNVQDVLDNTINIIDYTASVTLATNQSIANGLGDSINVGTILNTIPAIRTYQATALDLNSNPLTPAYFQIYWYWREWYGNNTLATLTASDIQNVTEIQNSYLSSSFPATYPFAAGGYKWFIWDDSLGSPTAVTGFKDSATNLQVSMADNTDDPIFFSHVQNGWYYGLVSVTQNGVTSNKRCYRTKNQLGGAINIIVS